MGQAGKKRKAVQGTAQASEAKLKLSYRDKAVRDLRQMGVRLARLAKKLGKLPQELTVVSDVNGMVQAFEGFAEQVVALADDWKPGRAQRGNSLVVVVGDTVRLREKSAKRYEDVFPAGTDLQVVDVRTALIGVMDPGGATVYVPRGHLETKGGESKA